MAGTVVTITMTTLITGLLTIRIMTIIIIIIIIIQTGIHPPVTLREGTLATILNLPLVIIMFPEGRCRQVTLHGMKLTITGR